MRFICLLGSDLVLGIILSVFLLAATFSEVLDLPSVFARLYYTAASTILRGHTFARRHSSIGQVAVGNSSITNIDHHCGLNHHWLPGTATVRHSARNRIRQKY